MTTNVTFIDPALHVAAFPATYTPPGAFLNLGVPNTAAPGTVTGTLPANNPKINGTDYSGGTYTFIVGNTVQDFEDDELSGYFTVPATATDVVIPVGFMPTKIEFIDTTVSDTNWYVWHRGMTNSIKLVGATPAFTDAAADILVSTDFAGNCVVTLIAAAQTAAHVFTFRIEG